jgi:hypothetical protein
MKATPGQCELVNLQPGQMFLTEFEACRIKAGTLC